MILDFKVGAMLATGVGGGLVYAIGVVTEAAPDLIPNVTPDLKTSIYFLAAALMALSAQQRMPKRDEVGNAVATLDSLHKMVAESKEKADKFQTNVAHWMGSVRATQRDIKTRVSEAATTASALDRRVQMLSEKVAVIEAVAAKKKEGEAS